MNATPRVVDNDRDEITLTLDGKEIRGWSYADEAERRVKMRMAREFVEGWLQATEASAGAVKALQKVNVEMSALVPNPNSVSIEDWPVTNPGDAECLQTAFYAARDALTDAGVLIVTTDKRAA